MAKRQKTKIVFIKEESEVAIKEEYNTKEKDPLKIECDQETQGDIVLCR